MSVRVFHLAARISVLRILSAIERKQTVIQ